MSQMDLYCTECGRLTPDDEIGCFENEYCEECQERLELVSMAQYLPRNFVERQRAIAANRWGWK